MEPEEPLERCNVNSKLEPVVRRGFTGLAVTGFILLAGSPAAAGAQEIEGGERETRAATSAEGAERAAPEFREEEGPVPGRTMMIESVSLADNAEIGIGLFSVVGVSEKEQIRRRTSPRIEVRERDRRVAAVGFSLRF